MLRCLKRSFDEVIQPYATATLSLDRNESTMALYPGRLKIISGREAEGAMLNLRNEAVFPVAAMLAIMFGATGAHAACTDILRGNCAGDSCKQRTAAYNACVQRENDARDRARLGPDPNLRPGGADANSRYRSSQ